MIATTAVPMCSSSDDSIDNSSRSTSVLHQAAAVLVDWSDGIYTIAVAVVTQQYQR
jgi:hypothetical protein